MRTDHLSSDSPSVNETRLATVFRVGGMFIILSLSAVIISGLTPFAPYFISKQAGKVAVPMLISSERGFNIISLEKLFYVVPQDLGDIDLTSINTAEFSTITVTESAAEAERIAKVRAEARERALPPVLVESLPGFNIVKFKGKFFVVPQTLGEVDLAAQNLETFQGVHITNDVSEARKYVMSVLEDNERNAPPKFLEDAGHSNIVQYQNSFYLISHTLGDVDLRDDAARSLPGVSHFKSLEEARAAARSETIAKEASGPPRLVATIAGSSNIVQYGGKYYVIPHKIGQIDLAMETDRQKPEIAVFDTLTEAEKHAKTK